ncbi:hypothetical protein [Nocardioides xinjiangensis]|uniref:hypothetical protein n=1 Tax=Nocardioides xinjiangensis TaxID=2817376 RepID=UPI001B31278E|nr:MULTISPECIES: hypothetical protein [unclassified Nocardioides]
MRLRPLATACAVLALAAPLSSCGFDYATDREYDVNSAAENREGTVDVLSAVVVSATEGSGTFIASLSNNDVDDEQTFTGVSGDEGESIEAGEFEPVAIPAGGLVNLAESETGVVLTGDFGAGEFIPLAVDFGNGERVTLEVPVVSNDSGYWEGLDAS